MSSVNKSQTPQVFTNRKCQFIFVAVVAAAAAVWWFAGRSDGGARPDSAVPAELHDAVTVDSGRIGRRPPKGAPDTAHEQAMADAPDAPPPSAATDADGDLPETKEEKIEREETRLVDEFDALTDKWMTPAKDGVAMDDIDRFAGQFRKVPKARKNECIHRALNLVPDENVMLLAGILMDKAQDREIVEAVFGNVLNRGEEVKKPILQQIFKDREHPCWADAAWILDVTGQIPGRNGAKGK